MSTYPECFVPKCRDCEYKEFCLSRKNGEHALPATPALPRKVKAKPAPPKKQKQKWKQKKRGKKLKDMTIEERREVWREYAAAKRTRDEKAGKVKKNVSEETEEEEEEEIEVEDGEPEEDADSVSDEKLGELLDFDLTLKLDVPHKELQFEILLDKSEEGYLLRALKERELAKMGVKKQ